MRGLAGKGVLVTGGTSGIGLATARRFLDEGSRVFVTGLEIGEVSATLDELGDLGEVDGIAGDVSREPDVEAIVERAVIFLGPIDVLINNAGIARKSPFLDTGSDDWDRIIAVNLRGMFLIARAVGRLMVAGGDGGAIVIASTNALGGEQLRRLQRLEGGRPATHEDDGGRAGCARDPGELRLPGFVDTPLNRDLATHQEFRDYERNQIPLGRRGTADEIAAVYAFLASDDASFVHGAALVVDGGQTAVM